MSLMTSVYAAPDFSVAFNVNYQATENGTTIVQKNIQLTNLTTNLYPAVYNLEIPQDAQNIFTFDGKGKIEPVIFEENGRQKIKLPLNEKALGKGKAVQFVLRFETKQIAFYQNGNWKIVIPKIESGEEIIGYNISLSFPQSWGKPSSIVPKPRESFSWTLEELKDAMIVISFGQKEETNYTPSEITKRFSPALLKGIVFGLLSIIFGLFLIKIPKDKT